MLEKGLFVPVEKDVVLRQAMELVGGAKQIVRATMLLSEEIRQPISPEYYHLLRRKVDEGIQVVRLGFGGQEDFDKIRLLPTSEGVDFIRVEKTELYQRMLIQDNRNLIFAIDVKKDRSTFFSDFPMLVQAFIWYFEQVKNENGCK